MHELSLCAAIAETALDHAKGRKVKQINLRIGHFRQVVPETLEFCWGLRADGPENAQLAECGLEIAYVPAVARCQDCGSDTTLEVPVLICAHCSGSDVSLTSGEEFMITSIDLDAGGDATGATQSDAAGSINGPQHEVGQQPDPTRVTESEVG